MLHRALVVVALGLAGCEILPTNPLDPATDPAFQERATLGGSVRAVLAPDVDGSVPAPGACAAAEGDHAGFVVVLRGLADTGAGIASESQATNAGGGFEFKDVPSGGYVVEVLRAGFAVPDPIELSLSFGEVRSLGVLCAVKTAPPAAPAVTAPPSLVAADNRGPGAVLPASLRIAAEGTLTYRVIETPDGDVAARDVVVDATAPVPLVLDATPGVADDDVRRLWRVDVVALDPLGNTSAPTSFLVVKDGLAPSAPTLTAVVGRDRVQLALQSTANVDDDAAASFVVGYAVVRPPEVDVGCPFGAPGAGDPVVHGGFAVEGRSPLAVTSPNLTLSGLQAGTNLFVVAAAVDAAGNASCWSTPALLRPDVVTFVPRSDVVTEALGGGRGATESDGAFAFARGAAGLVVVDRNHVGHTVDDAPALDVVFQGEALLAPAGLLGLRIIDLDDDGEPQIPRTISLGARSADVVAARPGRAFVGGPDGLTEVALDGSAVRARVLEGDGAGAITGLASWGQLLVVVRAGAENAVEVHRLVDVDAGRNGRVGRVVLATAPDELVVVDERVWLGQRGQGVAVVDIADCDVDATDCARVVARRSLGAVVTNLAAFDDAVLITDDDGRVTVAAFDDGAVRFIGQHDLDGGAEGGVDVAGVVAVAGGFCAGVSDVVGSRLSCLGTVQGPLVDEERRLADNEEGIVTRVAAGGGQGVHGRSPSEGAPQASLFGLDDGAVARTVAADGDLLTVAVPGTGFIVGDAVLFHDGSVGAVPLSTELLAAGLSPPYAGFGVVHGDRLVLGLVAVGGGGNAVVSARLDDNGAGFDLVGLAVVDLDASITQVVTAVLRRGRVFFGTQPFGVFAIDVDGGALGVEQALEVGGQAVDIAFIENAAGEDTVVVAGQIVEGGAPRERLFPVVGGVLDRNGGLAFSVNTLRGMTAFGDVLVVSTVDQGAVFVDAKAGALRPVLQVPSVAEVGQTQPTARGLICADGAAGTAWLVIR